MSERFGSQDYPGGGLRFGSQEYAPISAAAGVLAAIESGPDIFAAASYPRVTGALAVTEAGADAFAGIGSTNRQNTMQAVETGADAFLASVQVIAGSLRFGSQNHTAGGLRFGAQTWAALGPNGPMAATETGTDTAAMAGWLAPPAYTFQLFDVLSGFVNYSPESLGSGVIGTLDTGNKVMLPVIAPGGVTLAWETNAAGNPSLRLAQIVGASNLIAAPWYVWNGSTWTAAAFNVSDAVIGSAPLVETGADIFIAGSGLRGSAGLVESSPDFVQISGAVAVRGALSSVELLSDTFAAAGTPAYSGTMTAAEAGDDVMAVAGAVPIAGALASTETTADTFAATGRPSSAGSLAATESGADTLAGAGTVARFGAFAATESGSDAAAVAGVVRVLGAAPLAETGADVFEVDGSAGRVGALAAVELASDAAEFDGAVLVAGDMSLTDRPDVFSAQGVGELSGALAAVESISDRFVSRGVHGESTPLPTFDGPVDTRSLTRTIAIKSRRTNEAA